MAVTMIGGLALGGLAMTAVMLGFWFVRVDAGYGGPCYNRTDWDRWNWTDGYHCHGGGGFCSRDKNTDCHQMNIHNGHYCKQCCKNCFDDKTRTCELTWRYGGDCPNPVLPYGIPYVQEHQIKCCDKPFNDCDWWEYSYPSHTEATEFKKCENTWCHYRPCDNGKLITTRKVSSEK